MNWGDTHRNNPYVSILPKLKKLTTEDFVRIIGIDEVEYGYVYNKWNQYNNNKDNLRKLRNPNNAGRKRTFDKDTELLIFLLHIKRKMMALDIAFWLEVEEGLVQDTINRVEKELVIALEDEISMKTKEERLEIAKKYNHEDFHKITATIDGTIIQIRKPKDKKKQGRNWCYKGVAGRNAQVIILGNGEIGRIKENDSGNYNDITATKQSELWQLITPGEGIMADKGYE